MKMEKLNISEGTVTLSLENYERLRQAALDGIDYKEAHQTTHFYLKSLEERVNKGRKEINMLKNYVMGFEYKKVTDLNTRIVDLNFIAESLANIEKL